MPSITSWCRIEPAGPGNDVAAGLAARTADPLWLLARQWQVGEFQAEDGGTPIVARWRGQVIAPTRYHLGPIPPNTQLQAPHFDGGDVPLEVFVERQPCGLPAADAPGADGLRLGVDTGQHFLRLLAAQSTTQDYAPAFTRTFAVHALSADDTAGLDQASSGYLRVVAGRALDGRRLRAAIGRLSGAAVPDIGMPIASGDAAEVRAACAAWTAWVDELFSQPDAGEAGQTWQRDRMEYAFSFAARTSADPFDEWTLTASQYGGGALDWYSFDRNGDVNVGTTAGEADAGEVVTRTSLPAPVTLRGMPAPRFWEMEDALLDLGALQPGGTDLFQLLMIDTVSGYGNDWYVIAIDLPTGALVTTRSLVVTDTFGAQTLLRPNGHQATASSSAWSMFQLALPMDDGVDGVAMTNAFFLAGALAQPLEGPPIEEVLLLRDEQANLAWAVERRLTNPLEHAFDAASDALGAGEGIVGGESPDAAPHYRLASAVPPHWIPLLPVRPDPDSAEIRLSRASVLDVGGNGRRTITSRAALLGDPDEPMLIPEEEVPREGAVVRRSFQAARGPDGRLHVWLTHRKSVGRGEGSSGLRFDTLTSPGS
ncbi:MAG: hypothetical protein H0U21_09795 [Acidimicrobiia bacterium]|nr:hypothetical protein [Acidimicrobiia bacterium]